MSGILTPTPVFTTWTQNGLPNAFGTFNSYAAGTSTPIATYTDATLGTPNANPATFNAQGQLQIWLTPGLSYKFVWFDALGNQLGSVDQINAAFTLNNSLIPANNNVLDVGSPTFQWHNGYFGTSVIINGVPAVTYPQTTAETAASVTPSNFGYAPGDIRRYGALTASSDNSAALQAAINQCQQNGAKMYVPSGTWKYATGLLANANGCTIVGDHQLDSILQKTADVIGILVTAHASFQDVAFDSSIGGAADGIQVNTTGHLNIERVRSTHHGGHGLNVIQGNLFYVADFTPAFNTGDGIRLTGSGAIQANAGVFVNITSSQNTGWGFNILVGMSNFGLGIVCQGNTAGGVQLQTCFSNYLQTYTESNVGPAVSFAATCVGASFGGNQIISQFSDANPVFNGASGTYNAVISNKVGAAHQPGASSTFTDQLIFSNSRTDGGTPTGIFTASHSSNLQLDVIGSGPASTFKTKFANATGGQLHVVLADNMVATAAATGLGAGTLAIGNTTASTVGAAGGATALPATPLGYLIFNLANTQIKVPYYNN